MYHMGHSPCCLPSRVHIRTFNFPNIERNPYASVSECNSGFGVCRTKDLNASPFPRALIQFVPTVTIATT